MRRGAAPIPAILAFCSLLAAGEGDWPQWRGPGGSGTSDDPQLPTEWSATRNVRWKAALPGRGHSSPVVWGDRIFLTTDVEGAVVEGAASVKHFAEGKEFLHPDSVGADRAHSLRLLCLDRASGKILWERTAYEGTVYDNRHKKNTYASSTPVTDGRRVYAFFGAEGLYCYDFAGKLLWKAALGKIGQMGMGPGTSPVLHENLVIMQCDQELGEGSFVAAFEKTTGKKVWESARRARMSWATPVLARGAAGRVELVCSGAETVVAYDPATGRELWRAKGVEGHAIPSAVVGDGVVYVSAGFPAKRTYAIRLGGSGDVSDTPSVLWRYEKGSAYVPSPILYGGYLYLTTDRGLLTCIDAATGQVKYEGGRVPAPATFTASPVAFDGKIFLSSEDGDTFVVAAGPEHKVLGTNALGEPIFASPALSRGEIFIRGEKHLYCVKRSS